MSSLQTDYPYDDLEPKKKKRFPFVPVLLGVGALALLSGNAGFWNTDANLSDDDYKNLAAAQQNGDISSLLKGDTSPNYFTVPNDTLTYEQRSQLVANIATKYSAIVDKIADNLATESADIYSRIGLTLSGSLEGGKTMTERGMELYLKMLDIWTKSHATTAATVASEVTKLWLGAAVTDITTCTATTFVKDVTEESQVEQSRVSNVVVTTTAKNGFLGIVGRRKKTTEQHLSSSMEKRTDTRKIVFVPHCTSYEVDPNKEEVLYASTVMAVKILMAQWRASYAQCPDPIQFCSK
jgi:hypothetical protein